MKIDTQSTGNRVKSTISGVIDENSNFEQVFGEEVEEMTLTCKDIDRINSVGVLLWRRFFSKLRRQGVKIKFRDVAPVLMAQTAFIADLIQRSELESMCLPFTCTGCKKVTKLSLPPNKTAAVDATQKHVKCQHCGGSATFDDMIEEYIGLFE